MAFDRDDIEQVRKATNIVDLVEAVTTVKRRGRSYKAICPFHQEKTPSMSLDPARGLFHCFGCGMGGDIFKFVMETQALDFSEAVELLAGRAGVTLRVDPSAAKRRGERRRLSEANEAAIVFFQERLKKGADAGPARSYLRSRGYDGSTVDEFELGYSPTGGSRNTMVRALKEQGFTERQLIEAGVARKGNRGGVIDWFHGRVMFPIRDVKGEAVGFGARILEGDGPKYLNTPETRLYKKAELLYGLDRAKANITRTGFSVVVEGYTDVIALHHAGFPVAVASCGTALGEDHFDLLRRFSEKIVLAFDADQAGAGAAIRGDELHLPAELGLDLRVAVMPEGRDPADLVSEGKLSTLTDAIERSEPLLQFRLEREVAQFRLDEPEGRSRAVTSAATMVARLSDPVMRREYARFLSRLTGVDTESIVAAVDAAGRSSSKQRRGAGPVLRQASDQPPAPASPAVWPPPRNGQERAELELVRLMAMNHLADRAVDPDWLTREDYRSLVEVLVRLGAEHPGDPVDVAELDAVDPAMASFVRKLTLGDEPEADADELVARLRVRMLDRRIGAKRDELSRIDPESDRQTHSQVFEELLALERKKRSSGDS